MTTELIIALINLGFKFGPELVKDIAALIHGNPKQQDETDEAYIQRVYGMIDDNTRKVLEQDAAIQAPDEGPSKPPGPVAI